MENVQNTLVRASIWMFPLYYFGLTLWSIWRSPNGLKSSIALHYHQNGLSICTNVQRDAHSTLIWMSIQHQMDTGAYMADTSSTGTVQEHTQHILPNFLNNSRRRRWFWNSSSNVDPRLPDHLQDLPCLAWELVSKAGGHPRRSPSYSVYGHVFSRRLLFNTSFEERKKTF